MGLVELSLKASAARVLPFKLKIKINIIDVKKKKKNTGQNSAHFLLNQDDSSLLSYSQILEFNRRLQGLFLAAVLALFQGQT